MSASNFISLSSIDFYPTYGPSSSWAALTYTDWQGAMYLPNADAQSINTFVASNRFPTGQEPFSIVTQHVRIDGDVFNNPKLGDRKDLNVTGLPVPVSGAEVDAVEVPFGVVIPPSSSSSSSISSSSSSSQYIHYGYKLCTPSSSSSSKYLNYEYELCPSSSSSSFSSSSSSFSSSSSSSSSDSSSGELPLTYPYSVASFDYPVDTIQYEVASFNYSP